MFELDLAEEAKEFYRVAPRDLAKRLARAFAQIEQTPRRHPNIKPLKVDTRGNSAAASETTLVIYRVDDAAGHVRVLRIAHRCDIYE